MKIALDVMGGDHAPAVTVAGAVQAAREFGIEIILVGPEDVIRRELAKHKTDGLALPLVHASQVLEMTDHPATAARSKRDSTMAVGANLVKRGEADAFVTCGNTGGALATGLFVLGRIKGIKRPALTTLFPSGDGFCLLLDIGANTEVKPEYLHQFAVMGSLYAERVFHLERPRVAIVSNGEEEGKGSELVKETVPLLKADSGLNFVGNVEGKDIVAGVADVVITDGFTGNVIIKFGEGIVKLLLTALRRELRANLARNAALGLLPTVALAALTAQGVPDFLLRLLLGLAAALALPAALLLPGLRKVARRLDYTEYGSAPLLGLDGLLLVGHGRSNAKAVRGALRTAKQAVENNTLEAIRAGVQARSLGDDLSLIHI